MKVCVAATTFPRWAGDGEGAFIWGLTHTLKQQGVDVRVVSSGVEKTDGHPALPISDAAEGRLRARVGELSAMLFDEVMLHRTGIGPGLDTPRYAIETWFFAPSHYPVDQIPITF